MSAELLLLVLVLAAAAYVLLARWTRRRRSALGIGEGTIVSADDSLMRAPMLRSERLGLVGRCDHLLRVGDAYVPVEQKPSARRLQQSHILQVGALCLLVQEVYGVRPPYGVVVLADGLQEGVTFSAELARGVVRTMAELARGVVRTMAELARGVVRTMAEMRRILATGEPTGPRWGEGHSADPAATTPRAGATTRPT